MPSVSENLFNKQACWFQINCHWGHILLLICLPGLKLRYGCMLCLPSSSKEGYDEIGSCRAKGIQCAQELVKLFQWDKHLVKVLQIFNFLNRCFISLKDLRPCMHDNETYRHFQYNVSSNVVTVWTVWAGARMRTYRVRICAPIYLIRYCLARNI